MHGYIQRSQTHRHRQRKQMHRHIQRVQVRTHTHTHTICTHTNNMRGHAHTLTVAMMATIMTVLIPAFTISNPVQKCKSEGTGIRNIKTIANMYNPLKRTGPERVGGREGAGVTSTQNQPSSVREVLHQNLKISISKSEHETIDFCACATVKRRWLETPSPRGCG